MDIFGSIANLFGGVANTAGALNANLNPFANSTPEQNQSLYRTGAAADLWYSSGGTYDVVSNYCWTLNKNAEVLKEVPDIFLYEYLIDESTIKTQLSYYLTNVAQATITGNTNKLSPYKDLFPRNSTNNVYRFPYFSDVNFEINTPMWKSLDTLEQGAKFAEGIGGVLFGDEGAKAVKGFIDGATKLGGAALAAAYPKVGIMDRPKLWDSHDFRTIEVKFYLFNTVNTEDWKKNRKLCWLLINQNLFTKRDLITGVPPVYYEVFIPGQHYSFAACVTNLKIYNRGNMRRFTETGSSLGNPSDQSTTQSGNNVQIPVGAKEIIVPDAYEVNMTLTDMVMPSRNLFQAIQKEQNRISINSQTGAATVAPQAI